MAVGRFSLVNASEAMNRALGPIEDARMDVADAHKHAGNDGEGAVAEQLRAFLDRIERVQSEVAALRGELDG
jgi:hypothetical protein